MKKMDETHRKWILSLPLERKIELMDAMLKEKEIGHYMGFINILLEAPISEGGVSTEIIDEVFYKHYPRGIHLK